MTSSTATGATNLVITALPTWCTSVALANTTPSTLSFIVQHPLTCRQVSYQLLTKYYFESLTGAVGQSHTCLAADSPAFH